MYKLELMLDSCIIVDAHEDFCRAMYEAGCWATFIGLKTGLPDKNIHVYQYVSESLTPLVKVLHRFKKFEICHKLTTIV